MPRFYWQEHVRRKCMKEFKRDGSIFCPLRTLPPNKDIRRLKGEHNVGKKVFGKSPSGQFINILGLVIGTNSSRISSV